MIFKYMEDYIINDYIEDSDIEKLEALLKRVNFVLKCKKEIKKIKEARYANNDKRDTKRQD